MFVSFSDDDLRALAQQEGLGGVLTGAAIRFLGKIRDRSTSYRASSTEEEQKVCPKTNFGKQSYTFKYK